MAEGVDQNPVPPAWFENDSFWESAFPCLFPDEKFAVAEEEVCQLQS